MTRKFFGTDGIRGRANTPPMTADIALRVGQAAAKQFRRGDHRHQVVIAKDTRLSGYMLEPALVSGFVSMGMDVMLVGPMPTPAVAMLVRSLRADLGVMISASHNPYQDNGIKLFGPDGYKLSDEVELAIEAEMTGPIDGLCDAEKLGRARRLDDAPGRYIEYAKNTFPRGRRLDGMKIVVDCANGAAYKTAPAVLWELGADVVPIGVSPDGTNINRGCGSTYPSTMCEAVVAHHADIGIALDGDADRLILADEQGQVVDGDQLMGLIARGWHREGLLKGGGVVTTVMSNLGLERMLGGLGLNMIRTQVGDRYVVNEMRESGYNVGGEQSGHIVLNDHSTTGDGLIAALQVLVELQTADRPASEVCNVFDTVPQLLQNVRISGGNPLASAAVKQAIGEGESRLGSGGRLVIRPSGTEPLIRVMAEGDDAALVADVVGGIADVIAQTGD
ncbi:phosphoglucosamine mutase [Alphaproteobacteria bacterium HT1-32]|nr:phosphoglucosamine mutase [Alphaproteobacteria bacterium HT1-32]